MADETPGPEADAPGTTRIDDKTAKRLGQSPRDMVWSLVALIAIIALVMVFNRSCSFSPGGPTTEDAQLPVVDTSSSLRAAARSVAFPVRLPEVPAGWRGNSASTGGAGAASTVIRAGWLTPANYVQVSQSDASETDLLLAETEVEQPAARGVVEMGGAQWTVFPGRRSELAWVADLGDVRVLITGTGTGLEFDAAAKAVMEGEVLPRE